MYSGRMTFSALSVGEDGSASPEHFFTPIKSNAVEDEAKNPLELQIGQKKRRSKLPRRKSGARMDIDKVYRERNSNRRSEMLVGILNGLKIRSA